MADRPIEAAIWPEVERLFERARSLGPVERQAFLDAECGSDAALREHLERLLAAHDRLTALDPDAAFVTSLDAARASALLEEALPEPDTIGRFEVIRRIGRGGMGVIYLARDPALDRRLAVKLLPMALGADPAATRRFFDEARAASALDHPNIATVFEIGRTDDERPFIAMAYYEGETLRERLERGPLDVAEAAEIAAQVADGLAAAHGVGIVHRDIKPANLIVTRSGLVKILDFGVARTASVALTRTGATVGTVAYMSPEQTRGERVDGRADIWALGVVLYEMLAGTRPFRSDAHDAIVYAIRNDSPEPLRSLRAEVPPALEAIVVRCLTKDPAGRFASAAELAHALREAVGGAAAGLGAAAAARTVRGGAAAGHAGRRAWPAVSRIGLPAALYAAIAWPTLRAIGALSPALGLPAWVPGAALGLAVAGLVLVLLAVTGFARRPSSTARTLTLAALAILVLAGGGAGLGGLRAANFGPISTLVARGVIEDREPIVLADFSAAASDPTIGRAVTEALRIDLIQSPTVRLAEPGEVIGALWRMGRDPASGLPEDAARELAVREGYKAYIAGEVSALGGAYVVSARVVAAEDGATLVALRETARDSTGLIDAVDRLSKRVRERVGEPLRALRTAEPLPRVATASLPALRRYAEAFALAWAGGDDARIAALLEEAVTLDSTFASAFRGLATTYRNMRADHSRVVTAIERAYQLRDRLPERERLYVESAYHWQTWADPERTIEALRRIVAAEPDDLTSRANLGLALTFRGRFEEAEEVLRAGYHAGAPTVVPVNLAMAGYFRGRADEALAILDSISTAPDGSRAPNPFSENLRARLLGAEERWDEAERVALDVLDRFRDSPHVRSEASRTLWHLALVQGRLEEAERYFRSTVETYEAIGALDALARAHIQRADTRLHLLGDTVGARATLAHVLERPGFDLLAVGPTLAPRAAAVLAGIGDTATAARLIEEWEMLPIGRRSEPDGYSPEIARARIDLAAGRPIDAIERLEREATHGLQAINLLPDLGRAYHEAGQIEAAIDAMERYLEVRHVRKLHRIPGYLGPVLIRLADLYEATGNTEKAQEMHARLNSLWHAADPALGAQAELAGRRIAELSRLRAP